MKKIFTYITLVFLAVGLQAQQVEKSTSGSFALTNATIETITEGTKTGTVLIQNGKITGVGEKVDIPDNAEVIDCKGKTIYPGMIDGGTTLGLIEVGSVDLTNDQNELGDVNPHVQALTAVNPNAVAIPVTRVSGVTSVLAVPQGGVFSGTAALINLHGYTPQQMYAGFKAVAMNFPAMGRSRRWRPRSEDELKKERDKKLKTLNDIWDKAAQYSKIADAHAAGNAEEPDYYPEMAALVPAVKGEAKLLIEVNTASDIQGAIKWVQERKVDAIFTGVSEGWRVADEIAAANIPVITGPVLATPRRASDRYDRPYGNAGMMQKAGVKVAIRSNDSENVRNLPYNAGFAAAYGMGREEALKAITIVPAEIFGVSEELGSIEVGKVANLFVADGDPFETKTHVSHVFIEGWNVAMDSRHIRLYNEFLKRSPGLKE